MTHVASAGIWIGIELVLGVLVLTAELTEDVVQRAAIYSVVGVVTTWPMLVSGAVCLASGVVLGVGSKCGLVRYWWVAVKLVMNLVLLSLVVVLLRPGVADVVAHGPDLAAGRACELDASFLFFPPAVSLSALPGRDGVVGLQTVGTDPSGLLALGRRCPGSYRGSRRRWRVGRCSGVAVSSTVVCVADRERPAHERIGLPCRAGPRSPTAG